MRREGVWDGKEIRHGTISSHRQTDGPGSVGRRRPVKRPDSSPLDRSRGHSADQLLLDEEEEDDHWDGAHHASGREDAPFDLVLSDHLLKADGNGLHFGVRQHRSIETVSYTHLTLPTN